MRGLLLHRQPLVPTLHFCVCISGHLKKKQFFFLKMIQNDESLMTLQKLKTFTGRGKKMRNSPLFAWNLIKYLLHVHFPESSSMLWSASFAYIRASTSWKCQGVSGSCCCLTNSAHHINKNAQLNLFQNKQFRRYNKGSDGKVLWHCTRCVLTDPKSHLTCIKFPDLALARLAPFHFDTQRKQVEVWARGVAKGCERWRRMGGLTLERIR